MTSTSSPRHATSLRVVFAPEVSPADRKVLTEHFQSLTAYQTHTELLRHHERTESSAVRYEYRRRRNEILGGGAKSLLCAAVIWMGGTTSLAYTLPSPLQLALLAAFLLTVCRGVTSLIIARPMARRQTASPGRTRAVALARLLHRRYLRPATDLNEREQGLLEQAMAAYKKVTSTRIYRDGRIDTSVHGLALDAWIWDLAEALARTTALARAADLDSPSTGPKVDARRQEVLAEINRELGIRRHLVEQFQEIAKTVAAQDADYRDAVQSDALAAATDAALTDLKANGARLPYARKEVERMAEDLSLTREAAKSGDLPAGSGEPEDASPQPRTLS
jgi:hypothetical protein